MWSVWLVPYPSSHASHVPPCAGSAGPFCPMTPAVGFHDAVPDSNPGFSRTFPPPPPDELTVSEMLVECVADVPAPVTVTVNVPVLADDDAVNVRVELPPAVTEVGLKLAVVPDGTPLAESDTVWADPFVTAVEIVDVAA